MGTKGNEWYRSERCRVAEGDEPSKLCGAYCKDWLTTENPCSFHKDKRTDSGLQCYCIDCDRHSTLTRRMEKRGDESVEAVIAQTTTKIMNGVEDKARVRKIAAGVKKELAPLVNKANQVGKSAPKDGDSCAIRTQWQSDPVKRLASLKRYIPVAIKQCDGQDAAMAAALNIGMVEMMAAIEEDEELYALYEQAQNEAISKMESVMYSAGISGSSTDRSTWLKANAPDKYGSRTQVDVRNIGFEAPESGSGPRSVLPFPKDGTCDSNG